VSLKGVIRKQGSAGAESGGRVHLGYTAPHGHCQEQVNVKWGGGGNGLCNGKNFTGGPTENGCFVRKARFGQVRNMRFQCPSSTADLFINGYLEATGANPRDLGQVGGVMTYSDRPDEPYATVANVSHPVSTSHGQPSFQFQVPGGKTEHTGTEHWDIWYVGIPGQPDFHGTCDIAIAPTTF